MLVHGMNITLCTLLCIIILSVCMYIIHVCERQSTQYTTTTTCYLTSNLANLVTPTQTLSGRVLLSGRVG